MLYNILYVSSVTVFAIIVMYNLMIILSTSLRNGDDIFYIRRFVLNYIARMSGHRTLFLNKEEDGDLCIEVLNSSNMKGRGIEYWFASPAWYPIFNIESVDGHVWKSTKMYFHTILKPLKICNIERFAHYVSEKLVNDVLSGKKACINSKDFSLMPAAIFHMFLFGSDISEDTSDIFYNASNEWRKHVAVKGHGDISIKLKMLHRVKDLIIYSGLYSHEIMSKAISLDPELLTAFIQPFFISSMINFSDIFVEVFKMLRQDRSGERHALQQLKNTCQNKSYLESFKTIESIILECIRLKHPFPVLERELTQDIHYKNKLYTTGTQVFIEFDRFQQDQTFDHERWLCSDTKNPYAYMPFGTGPRRCAGQHLAVNTFVPILYNLMIHDAIFTKITPSICHKYSGRDNDVVVNIWEAIYLLTTLICTCVQVTLTFFVTSFFVS